MGMKKFFGLKLANRILLYIIIGCNAYVLLFPLWPKVDFTWQTKVSKPVNVNIDQRASLDKIDKSFNHVIMPDLQLDQKIYEGTNPNTVNRGVWHLPNSSSPDKPSNTVLVGHRFSYHNPAVFYSLDQLKVGEKIIMVWDKKLYVYTIHKSLIVNPSDLSVEAPSSESMLTIYTCTPLWSTRNRLVVQSSLDEVI